MTSDILMIEPVAFGFNEETATNNFFQQRGVMSASEIQKRALAEFKEMVEKLRSLGVNVVTIADTPEPHTPDSIFPNNWITLHADGGIALYPMFAENRRNERRMDIVDSLIEKGYKVTYIKDYTESELAMHPYFLEGTGSMVIDRDCNTAYAALSPRTDKDLFMEFCKDFNYTPCYFHAWQTVNNKRELIYHTNVMMCIADKYAIVCLEAIDNEAERDNVVRKLSMDNKVIIAITEEQVKHFAGNMLQIMNTDGIPFLILSTTAYDSLTQQQIDDLSTFNQLIPISIPTIEHFGGGGVRCMMAEIYNPK